MAEFQWWLLLVGLVAGGGLVAVVFLDGARREADIEEAELPAEAQWIAARLAAGGDLEPRDVEAVLREHREYRLLPPPDRLEPIDPEPARPPTPAAEDDGAALAAARSAARASRADEPLPTPAGITAPAEEAGPASVRHEPPPADA